MWNRTSRSFRSSGRRSIKYFGIDDDTNVSNSKNRVVKISPDNDPAKTHYPRNRIVSNKYTLWNFIPKNLFEQFRRVANFYFLVSSIITLVIDSPISPLTSLFPLLLVISVTACKQGYESYTQYCLDCRMNYSLITVVRNKCIQEIKCQDIVVGDLVKVTRDQDIPCDIVLLHSSNDDNCCYVTTSNLDGETNLKTLYVPKDLLDYTIHEIGTMNAIITCQYPMVDLYTFQGVITAHMNDETIRGYLSVENLLLRGAKLKDTDYVIGCAIYTGQETKLSLNSKTATCKFSTAERSINRYLITFIVILFCGTILSMILKQIWEVKSHWNSYLGYLNTIGTSSVIQDFFNFLILYNYVVPISLYVTAEMQKFLSSRFFCWDLEMYDEENDQSAIVNTSDLNEELGQVQYLLSDKTGTLTENLMIFRRCAINDKVYMENDCDGCLYLLPPNGDERDAVKLTVWKPDIWHFFLSISLCHTVRVASESVRASAILRRSEYRDSFKRKKITRVNSSLLMHPDLPEYEAASADEKALVEASARCGVIFQRCKDNIIEIQICDQILYFKRLDILEFNSDRKRMSVIVQDSEDEIWLYCKGADTAIFPLISHGKIKNASKHVSDFSMRGLRTLVIGYKRIDSITYENWIKSVKEAQQQIGPERNVKVDAVYKQIESGLTLLSITAVEDRLQENVQETIESLRIAGIKIWILTGDKAETAENISYSCGHFKRGTEILKLMRINDLENCYTTLITFERRIKLEPAAQYGLMIDGTSIKIAYKYFRGLLRTVAISCYSVVCCRMSPLQKSEMVQLLKKCKKPPLTAAIGDGGNDVSMIIEAHVGIGIFGKEGRQAAMSADFAITKFMHLKKALLVHGHWYYERISSLILYFFYKNVVFVLPQFFYSIHNGFSTQALYDSMFMMCFNIMFSSLPVLLYGLLEQKFSGEKLLNYPVLYRCHSNNGLLCTSRFILWLEIGIWHASVIYFVSYIYWTTNTVNLHDSTPADLWCYSVFIIHLVTLVTNLQILLHSSFWSLPFVSSIFMSILIFFILSISYCSIKMVYDGNVYWVYHKLLNSPTFWILTLLILVVCFVPSLLISFYYFSKMRYSPLNFN